MTRVAVVGPATFRGCDHVALLTEALERRRAAKARAVSRS